MSTATVRYAAELGVGDRVRTPLGRVAVVEKLWGDCVLLTYLDDGGERVKNGGLSLKPDRLTLVAKAQPHALPGDYFGRRRVAPKPLTAADVFRVS